MEKDTREELKRLAMGTEVKLTESLLRWKHRREGKAVPEKQDLEQQSRLIADHANKVLSKSGKALLSEIKGVCRKGLKREDRKN